MRFADIPSESAPANYDIAAGRHKSECTLADLPTIKFQAVSGLEISLPVIVDCLLTTYIEELCPRRIFSALERGREVEAHEKNMMRTALCTVYTVLTRCRGPLIWLEDDLKSESEKVHPLVRRLFDALKEVRPSFQYDFQFVSVGFKFYFFSCFFIFLFIFLFSLFFRILGFHGY